MSDNNKKLQPLRHSLAHILAMAVKQIYGDVKLGVGPTTENGFYYDFGTAEHHGTKTRNITEQKRGTSRKISKEDLPQIEDKMRELIAQNLKFKKEILKVGAAKKLFKEKNEPYKVELIEDLEKEQATKVSIYKSGDFIDLCKGPHIKSTKQINPQAFKLTKVAGAYWKGDETRPQLQRIYGVAFETKKELNQYVKRKKEAQKRDHRKLGLELDLFHIDKQVGPGLILWHPKGAHIKRKISQYVLDKYLNSGYQLVNTPHIADLNLWKKSGHTDFYAEDMYPPMHTKQTKRDYQLKPMNCPFHMQIYKSQVRSYRDLPLRYAELGTVYRYEKTGVLHGLTRARGFTQDDAHIFCAPEQLGDELLQLINLTEEILTDFGFEKYKVNLSVRDPEHKEKYMGEDKRWDLAEKELEEALKKKGWKYQRDKGEAVFYGPKIDLQIEDALGRLWQISTIQVDFNLPQRFNIHYRSKKSKKQQPMVIHRALLGSIERFLGILIEHYGGAFPFWLAPEQIRILTVSELNTNYAEKIKSELEKENFRIQLDASSDTVSKKIRNGEIQKIPYLIVVGDKEQKSKSVNVRSRNQGILGEMKLDKFIKRIKKEIRNKK